MDHSDIRSLAEPPSSIGFKLLHSSKSIIRKDTRGTFVSAPHAPKNPFPSLLHTSSLPPSLRPRVIIIIVPNYRADNSRPPLVRRVAIQYWWLTGIDRVSLLIGISRVSRVTRGRTREERRGEEGEEKKAKQNSWRRAWVPTWYDAIMRYGATFGGTK